MQVSKELVEKFALHGINEKKLTKSEMAPFPIMFYRFSSFLIDLIFTMVLVNNLCKFQKNQKKYVDFIA